MFEVPAQPVRYVRRALSAAYPVEWAAYKGARWRCNTPTSSKYKDYGGRGIQFRYESFEQFMADLGPRPSPAHSLDRERNDGHYEPGNCRWATRSTQVANRRAYKALANVSDADLLEEAMRRGFALQ